MVKTKKRKKREPSTKEIGQIYITLLFNLTIWLTGIIISLSVGFGMIGGTLSLPIWLGGKIVSMVAGWIVIITTLIGIILSISKVNLIS